MYFKYKVDLEYFALVFKKEQGFLSDSLPSNSKMHRGLSTSNIWNWAQQLDKLKFALTHETATGRNQKNTLWAR